MSKELKSSHGNVMRQTRIGKITANISVGQSGEPLEKAMRVLEELTSRKPAQRKAKKTLKTFGIRQGEPIACLVTLRGDPAERFLKRLLEAVGGKLKESCFDDHGNISFGIKEHIEISDTKYDPEIGIYGLNVNVALERPGYRIMRKSIRKAKVSKTHFLKREDAINFMINNFGIQVGEVES